MKIYFLWNTYYPEWYVKMSFLNRYRDLSYAFYVSDQIIEKKTYKVVRLANKHSNQTGKRT